MQKVTDWELYKALVKVLQDFPKDKGVHPKKEEILALCAYLLRVSSNPRNETVTFAISLSIAKKK